MTDVTEAAEAPEDPSEPSGPRQMLRDTRDAIALVVANRNIRKIQLAFAGSAIGDWAYATAIAVWAYGEGGAKAVGIWMAIRFTLMAVTSPFTSILADKMSRKKLMIITDFARAVLVAAAAACLYLDTPAWPIYVLATLASLLGTPFRVAQRALLPSLAERPEELTGANATSSTIESLAFFVGPALGAILLGFTTVQAVFLVNVATFLFSMVMVMGIRVPADRTVEAEEPEEGAPEEAGPGFLKETAAGFSTILADRGLLTVTAAVAVQTIIAGASAVFVVVMAADILGTGPRGVGYLDSVLGIGAIVGGMLAMARARKGKLGSDLAIGVVLWSLPLVLVTIWPSPASCFAAMALLGLGNPLVDVNMDTLVQRLTPSEVMGRVFGALEACLIATMAIGALAMPFFIEWLGLRWALTAIALPVVGLLLLVLPVLRTLDTTAVAPAALALIKGVDIFAPLAVGALESLAQGATERRFAAGEEILREGGESDRFYVISSGLVEVTQADRVLRQEGPGDYFGEIGLLRDVPRTATITALEETVVLTVDREDFLKAVSGHREAKTVAENAVTRRLAV